MTKLIVIKKLGASYSKQTLKVAEHLVNNLGYEVDFTDTGKITGNSVEYVWVDEAEENGTDGIH